jgi:phytoene synthase
MTTLEAIDQGTALVGERYPRPARLLPRETAFAPYVGATNDAFFWSTRLLPMSRRKAIRALYAFCSEVNDVADATAPRKLKLALLADWRDQIALLYAGRPPHVVTQGLHDAIERFDLRRKDFLAVIEGIEKDSSADIRAPSLDQLDLYCEQKAVAVSRIALRIFGVAASEGERVADALGRGMLITGILRDLAEDATRQRLYLPRELLQAHGIFATMPSYVLAQPALPHICNALAQRAAGHFADAERAIPAGPRCATLAATAMLTSYCTLLDALLARGWARLDDPVRIPDWCRTVLLIGHGLIGR